MEDEEKYSQKVSKAYGVKRVAMKKDKLSKKLSELLLLYIDYDLEEAEIARWIKAQLKEAIREAYDYGSVDVETAFSLGTYLRSAKRDKRLNTLYKQFGIESEVEK